MIVGETFTRNQEFNQPAQEETEKPACSSRIFRTSVFFRDRKENFSISLVSFLLWLGLIDATVELSKQTVNIKGWRKQQKALFAPREQKHILFLFSPLTQNRSLRYWTTSICAELLSTAASNRQEMWWGHIQLLWDRVLDGGGGGLLLNFCLNLKTYEQIKTVQEVDKTEDT